MSIEPVKRHFYYVTSQHYEEYLKCKSKPLGGCAHVMQNIAIINEKGGVGKTATATTLAYLLSKKGHRTALLDFDGQGH